MGSRRELQTSKSQRVSRETQRHIPIEGGHWASTATLPRLDWTVLEPGTGDLDLGTLVLDWTGTRVDGFQSQWNVECG